MCRGPPIPIKTGVFKMKHQRMGIRALSLALCVITVLVMGLSSLAGAAEPDNEVRVPISLSVDYAIAGAEFQIQYSSGLIFVKFEKSEAIKSAATTPVVQKRGKTYLGFYSGSNDYVPVNGLLDIGELVFTSSGSGKKTVKITQVKYVDVIDKDNVNSEIMIFDEEFEIPLASGDFLTLGDVPASYTWLWFTLPFAVALAIVLLFLYKRKREKKKLAAATEAPAAKETEASSPKAPPKA